MWIAAILDLPVYKHSPESSTFTEKPPWMGINETYIALHHPFSYFLIFLFTSLQPPFLCPVFCKQPTPNYLFPVDLSFATSIPKFLILLPRWSWPYVVLLLMGLPTDGMLALQDSTAQKVPNTPVWFSLGFGNFSHNSLQPMKSSHL